VSDLLPSRRGVEQAVQEHQRRPASIKTPGAQPMTVAEHEIDDLLCSVAAYLWIDR